MNRAAATAAAFSVGLLVSLAAVSASDRANTPRPGELLGPLDVDVHCKDRFGENSSAVSDTRNAYGWICARQENRIFDTQPVDYDDACVGQYGAAAVARPRDDQDPNSWECFYGE